MASFTKIRTNYPNLQALRFCANNLKQLHQLKHLKQFKLQEIDISMEDNPVVSHSTFQPYLLHLLDDLRVISGKVIKEGERLHAEKLFGGNLQSNIPHRKSTCRMRSSNAELRAD